MPLEHDFKRFPELTNRQMPIFYMESPHKQITMDFFAKVTDVHDGDTIRVKWDERDFTFPIRLLDIQAPELNEVGGDESRKFLDERLNGENVRVEIDRGNRVGKWGRLLGRIKILGMDVAQESISRGFARPFGGR